MPASRRLLQSMLTIAIGSVLFGTNASFAQSFDSGTEGWTQVTMCYRPGFVGNNDPILLLPCCPAECPSSQQCVVSVRCGNLWCELNNPGGYLESPDVDGTCSVGQVQYYAAPAATLAALASAFNGSLTFDLQSLGGGSIFAQEDVIIDGGGIRIVRSIAAPNAGSWTSYAVPLAAGDWHVTSPTGPLASGAQIQSALANADALYLRSEFRLGPDTGLLDNVAVNPAQRRCLGDLDHNGVVDAADLAILLGAWGGAGGDLDANQTTNAADLAILLGAWGPC